MNGVSPSPLAPSPDHERQSGSWTKTILLLLCSLALQNTFILSGSPQSRTPGQESAPQEWAGIIGFISAIVGITLLAGLLIWNLAFPAR